MERNYYNCDGGTIAVECGGSIIRYNNGWGDGTYEVCKFESEEEFRTYKEEQKKYSIGKYDYEFISSAYFKDARVLEYDCLETISSENVLFILNGVYGIYYYCGKVFFVKW